MSWIIFLRTSAINVKTGDSSNNNINRMRSSRGKFMVPKSNDHLK